ncbi:hypothetical protein Efla_000723 [Eimeria flavescens]
MRGVWGYLAVWSALARPLGSRGIVSSRPLRFPVPLDPSLCAALLLPKLHPFTTLSSSSSSSSEMARVSAAAASERLQAVRQLLQQQQIDGLLVEDADAHGSEIPAPAFERRSFLSAFNGSYGTALVTQGDALLWTDGRYFVQAEQQLAAGLWTLMRQGTPRTPSLEEYLKANRHIRRLAFDSFSTSTSVVRQLTEAGFSLAKSLEAAAAEDSRRLLIPLHANPVDEVWGPARPPPPKTEVYVHPKAFCGSSCQEKTEKAVKEMVREGADLLLLSSLDDVAWLTNLRGSDVPHSPVFYTFALLVCQEEGKVREAALASQPANRRSTQAWRLLLYADSSRVSAEAKAELVHSGAVLREYTQLTGDLGRLLAEPASQPQQQQGGGLVAAVDALLQQQQQQQQQDGEEEPRRLLMVECSGGEARHRSLAWLDPKVNAALHEIVAERRQVLLKETPVTVAKAAKSAAELRGMAEAHELDGVALATFFCWLEKQIHANAAAAAEGERHTQQQQQQQRQQQECMLSEWTIKESVDFARSITSPEFRGPSFSSISCLGSNCALAHYRPQPDRCFLLRVLPAGACNSGVCVAVEEQQADGQKASRKEEPIFLLDSGGQYLGGTTDVTRTMHLGKPTEKQKQAFSLVLKGVIGLSAQRFPEGVKGPQLDALARQHLWNEGLDYLHGTGHGVGHFLNVHEGPIGISPRLTGMQACYELQPGTVVSIEPGFYADGEFGIRTENLVAVEKSQLSYRGRGFLQFSTLTLVPIQAKMIDLSLLTPQEVAWLDAYHAEVYSKISRRLMLSAEDRVFCPPLPNAVSVTNEEVLAWLRRNTRALKELLEDSA